jgi:hypothetical protein
MEGDREDARRAFVDLDFNRTSGWILQAFKNSLMFNSLQMLIPHIHICAQRPGWIVGNPYLIALRQSSPRFGEKGPSPKSPPCEHVPSGSAPPGETKVQFVWFAGQEGLSA